MNFEDFFCPDSVAVIGAAREDGKVGRIIFEIYCAGITIIASWTFCGIFIIEL